MVIALAFCKKDNVALCHGVGALNGLLPEVEGHAIGIIAPEAVDVGLVNPVVHGLDHGLAHVLVVEVEVGHIQPIGAGRVDDGATGILSIPAGTVEPGVVPSGVVGYPVEHHGHAAGVCGISELAEIGQAAILAGHGFVIAYRVGRIHRVHRTNGVDGHKPNDVGAQTLDVVEFGDDGLQIAARTKSPQVYLVHDDVFDGGQGGKRLSITRSTGRVLRAWRCHWRILFTAGSPQQNQQQPNGNLQPAQPMGIEYKETEEIKGHAR